MKAVVLAIVLAVISTGVSAQDVKVVNGLYCKDGAAYTGNVETDNADGSLKSLMTVVDGKLQGPAIFYYPSGKVMETGSYVASQKSGLWVRNAENGVKIGEGSYFNGQKHGKWLVWDDKGQKRFEMEYINGQKANTWYSWDEKGDLVATTSYDKM